VIIDISGECAASLFGTEYGQFMWTIINMLNAEYEGSVFRPNDCVNPQSYAVSNCTKLPR
jgi:hypothetical protein